MANIFAVAAIIPGHGHKTTWWRAYPTTTAANPHAAVS